MSTKLADVSNQSLTPEITSLAHKKPVYYPPHVITVTTYSAILKDFCIEESSCFFGPS